MVAFPTFRTNRVRLALAALVALPVLLLAGLWWSLPDPGALAARPPATTALIEQRRAEALVAHRPFRPAQAWRPLERISPRLVAAVVASEDAKFFDHRGFDWEALRDAARHDLRRGGFARGASTISQQLAKNLWLGTHKSLWRKAREAVATVKLERALDKRRVLALYLNVAEWGDGVFGVEAGARRHLGVGAEQLTTAQAVLLASMLPAPRRVDLAHPSGWLRYRATHLLDRLRDEHQVGLDEHRAASAELARLLGGPAVAPTAPIEPPEEEEAPEAPAAVAPDTIAPVPGAAEPSDPVGGTSEAPPVNGDASAPPQPVVGQGPTPPPLVPNPTSTATQAPTDTSPAPAAQGGGTGAGASAGQSAAEPEVQGVAPSQR